MNNRSKFFFFAFRRLYNALLFTTCGLAGLLYGLDMGIIAAALPYIRESCGFSSPQLSGIVAAVILGSAPGSVLAGVVCDRWGRLTAFRLTALVFAVAVPLVCLSGGNFMVMFAGRFLQGIGCGLVAIAAPLYLTETAEAKHRGMGAGLIQLVLMVGLVLAAGLGVVVVRHFGAPELASVANRESAWQLLFWLTMVPAVLFFLLTLPLRESPRWLYDRGLHEKARQSLVANHLPDEADRVMADMAAGRGDDSQKLRKGECGGESLLQRRYVVPFLLVLAAVFFNQASGCNAIINYSVVIFNKAGLAGTSANYADTLLKSCGLVTTFLAVLLVDRVGRRTLLRIGTSGIFCGLAVSGGVFFVLSRGWLSAGPWTGWAVAIGFVIFMSSFCFGPGVCIWLVMSELMPLRIRACGMMIANFVGMGVAWAIAQAFLPWSEQAGEFCVFITLAVVSTGYLLLAVFVLPETKGKSLEEIERFFTGSDR